MRTFSAKFLQQVQGSQQTSAGCVLKTFFQHFFGRAFYKKPSIRVLKNSRTEEYFVQIRCTSG